jgi:hypothetical protein
LPSVSAPGVPSWAPALPSRYLLDTLCRCVFRQIEHNMSHTKFIFFCPQIGSVLCSLSCLWPHHTNRILIYPGLLIHLLYYSVTMCPPFYLRCLLNLFTFHYFWSVFSLNTFFLNQCVYPLLLGPTAANLSRSTHSLHLLQEPSFRNRLDHVNFA